MAFGDVMRRISDILTVEPAAGQSVLGALDLQQQKLDENELMKQQAQQKRQSLLSLIPQQLEQQPALAQAPLDILSAVATQALKPQTPDLKQDVGNILIKAQSGQPLTPAEEAKVRGFNQLRQQNVPDELGVLQPKFPALIEQNKQTETQDLQDTPFARKERAKLSEARRGKLLDNVFESTQASRAALEAANQTAVDVENIIASGGTTNPFASGLAMMGSLANAAGMNVDISQISSVENLEAFSNKQAVPMTKALGVNPTDKDFSIVKSTVAGAGKTPEANFALIDIVRQTSMRQERKQAMIDKLQESGASEIEIKRAERSFNNKNSIQEVRQIPKNPNRLIDGSRYATNKGVLRWDSANQVFELVTYPSIGVQ